MARTDAELLQLFRTLFPELTVSEVSDADAARWIELAGQFHSLSDHARVHCAAHLLTLAATEQDGPGGVDGGAGLHSSEMLGAHRIDYALSAAEVDRDGYFARTPYGRTFLTLERRATVGIRVF